MFQRVLASTGPAHFRRDGGCDGTRRGLSKQPAPGRLEKATSSDLGGALGWEERVSELRQNALSIRDPKERALAIHVDIVRFPLWTAIVRLLPRLVAQQVTRVMTGKLVAVAVRTAVFRLM